MVATSRLRTVLHLGCGRAALPQQLVTEGWRELRLDIDPGVQPDLVASMLDMQAVASGSVEAVYAAHGLPCLALHELPQALLEIHRVLCPGGVAWLIVPDLALLAPHLGASTLDTALFQAGHGPVTAADLLWGRNTSRAGASPYNTHRSGYTAQTLSQALAQAGFAPVHIEHQPALFEMMATATRPRPLQAQPKPSVAAQTQHVPSAQALFEQGRAAQQAGQWAVAEGLYAQALQKDRQLWPAHFERGVVSFSLGRHEQAIEHVQSAIALEPRFARAHAALGAFQGLLGRHDQAAASLQRAVELEPGSAENHYNLGKALQEQGALSAAEDAYRQALKCDPTHAVAAMNLGKVMNEQGQTVEGLALYRSASTRVTDPGLFSSLPMLMNFVDSVSDDEVFQAHRDFDQRHAAPLAAQAPAHAHAPDPRRRLRLAYLSRDLRQHSVRYFLLPITAHHDHAAFEVVMYHDHPQADAVTAQYRAKADRWVDCHAWSDSELAERIRADGIDILVDLGGHTNSNRLLVMARQPAPVQVTYLGYPATTGLTAIGHRISDRWIDPLPPMPAVPSSEQPLRLAHGYFCYAPMADSPAVGPPPFERNGFITFGSLNQGSKLTPMLLRQWAALLSRLPDARLRLQNAALHESRARQRLSEAFAGLGIAPRRLSFSPFAPAPDYLKTYHDIDIALDSAPYNGGTTTCEALWMGVPVVSWCGGRHVSRLGASVLNTVGLADLVADSAASYVQKALELAASPDRLRQLRQGLRQQMQASPLMDHAGFTRELEQGYRSAWQQWCAQASG